MAEELKVGGELDAWCTSCKLMKWHTIVALVDGKPAKVECQGCGKQHQFRPGPPGSATVKSRGKTATPAPVAPPLDFETLLAGRAGEAQAYSPDVRYEL